LPFLLAMGAGMFIYIACSDLIPEIHRGYERAYERTRAVLQTALFFGGVLLMWSVVLVVG
jgi:zinc transporter ZupT